MVTAGQVWWRAELICLRKMFSPQHRGTTTTTAYKVEADVLLTWHIELDPIAGCNHSDIYYKPKVASGLFVNSCFDFSLTFSGIFLNSGFNITTSHYDNQQRARRSSGAEMIRISTSCLPWQRNGLSRWLISMCKGFNRPMRRMMSSILLHGECGRCVGGAVQRRSSSCDLNCVAYRWIFIHQVASRRPTPLLILHCSVLLPLIEFQGRPEVQRRQVVCL